MQFALDHSIGFVDVIEKTDRIKSSASDADLRNIHLRDMSALLECNKNNEVQLFFHKRPHSEMVQQRDRRIE